MELLFYSFWVLIGTGMYLFMYMDDIAEYAKEHKYPMWLALSVGLILVVVYTPALLCKEILWINKS